MEIPSSAGGREDVDRTVPTTIMRTSFGQLDTNWDDHLAKCALDRATQRKQLELSEPLDTVQTRPGRRSLGAILSNFMFLRRFRRG